MGARQTRLHNQRKDVAKIPRWLRPKLRHDQLRDLSIAHLANIDTVIHGQGTEQVLWDMAGGVLTWYAVSVAIGLGEPEMLAQLHLVAALLKRFQTTGGVGFTGPEYQLAKLGVDQMDALASQVDQATAEQAALWSEDQVAQLAAAYRHQSSPSCGQGCHCLAQCGDYYAHHGLKAPAEQMETSHG